VALALHALEANLAWNAVSADDIHRTPGDALDALSPTEKAAVLDQLLDARPELRTDASRLAVQFLAPRTRTELIALQEKTATEVEQALRTLDIDQLETGSRSGLDYVDEYEAAEHLIERVLDPYEADVRRRLALGMLDAAEAVALGVLDGLDACEDEEHAPDHDPDHTNDGDDNDHDNDHDDHAREVLHYAGEDLAESYGHTIRELMHTAGRAVE
jgi:hypothetical protein